ncbi:hypothetical protein CCB80_00385 [Armatimonadetes bacterium Uphvl-Ar1]|nr:hypothetical protein CCB80_00385 [Armatimonadetes bacterium Uphvl-Ar1]
MSISERLVKAPRRKWVIGCSLVGVLVLGLFGFAVLQVVDYPVVALRADRVAAEYRAAGLPWVAEDLEKLSGTGSNIGEPMVTILEDGAPLWSKKSQPIFDLVGEGKYREAKALVDGLRSPTVDEFAAMSSLDRIWLTKDWDLGPNVLFPEYADVKTGVKMLAARAEVRARVGDLDGSVADLKASYAISNNVGRNSNLIAMLVGIACRSITNRAVLYAAEARPNDAAWIDRLRVEVESWRPESDLNLAMQGEAYMGVAFYRNFQGRILPGSFDFEDSNYNPPDRLVRRGFPKGVMNRAMMVRHMEAHLDMQNIVKKYEGDPVGMTRALDKFTASFESGPLKLSQFGNRVLFPVYSQAGEAVAKDEMMPKIAAAVLWARGEKIRTGSYPKTGKRFEIVDFQTGDFVKVKIIGERIVVYSVGKDGIDQGGANLFDSGVKGDDLGEAFPPKKRESIVKSGGSSGGPGPR